jgi:hypothetical protein
MVSLSESFYIFLVTSSVGVFLAFIKLVYDSKCKKIKLCGVEIERDTQAEANIEHDRLEHGIIDNPVRDGRQSLDRST